MFTIFHQFKAKPAPEAFTKRLLYLLSWYQQQPQGEWLRSINVGAMKYRFCQSMSVDNGVMGAFSPLKSDTIVLMPCQSYIQEQGQEPDSFDIIALQGWAQLIAPTAIHQLRHKWQSLQYGPIKYTLLSLPVVREFTIQSDADRITVQAEKLIEMKAASDTAGKHYGKQAEKQVQTPAAQL